MQLVFCSCKKFRSRVDQFPKFGRVEAMSVHVTNYVSKPAISDQPCPCFGRNHGRTNSWDFLRHLFQEKQMPEERRNILRDLETVPSVLCIPVGSALATCNSKKWTSPIPLWLLLAFFRAAGDGVMPLAVIAHCGDMIHLALFEKGIMNTFSTML